MLQHHSTASKSRSPEFVPALNSLAPSCSRTLATTCMFSTSYRSCMINFLAQSCRPPWHGAMFRKIPRRRAHRILYCVSHVFCAPICHQSWKTSRSTTICIFTKWAKTDHFKVCNSCILQQRKTICPNVHPPSTCMYTVLIWRFRCTHGVTLVYSHYTQQNLQLSLAGDMQ